MQFPRQPPGVVLLNPRDFEKVYRVTMDNPIRFGIHSLKKVRYEAENDYFNKQGGILCENDEEWWRVRSQVQTPMMKPKNVTRFIADMDGVAQDFIGRIRDFQNKFGEMPANFQDEIYKWALESVGTVAFNRRLGCLQPGLSSDSEQLQMIKAVNNIFNLLLKLEMSLQLWRYFPTPVFSKFKKSHETLCSFTVSNIRMTMKALSEKSSSEDDLTLMEILLSNPKLQERDVVTMILDMMFAGIDTTSHTIGFALYLLAKNPKEQEKLYQEISSILPDKDTPITASHLGRMSYLKSCIKETFRLFPLILGTQRTLEKDTVLGGYLVPKGHAVMMLNMASSRDETNFPRPNDFIPERWLRDRELGDIHPFASLPFSHGTRMCVGRRIAEQEMFLFLIRAIQNFQVDYKYGDMGIKTSIVNMPSEPLKFNFYERK